MGFALFDRLEQETQQGIGLTEYSWKRKEIENYLCSPRTLLSYIEENTKQQFLGPLFEGAELQTRMQLMNECIQDLVPPAAMRNPADRWWTETKATDDFLDRLFEEFFRKLGLPNLMMKTHYHILAQYVPVKEIDPEVIRVLDMALKVGQSAHAVRVEE